MPKKLTLEQVIKKFKEVHGDRFDYSLVNYENMNSKVDIICDKGHVFDQKPSEHLRGYGCRFCANNVKTTKEEFLQKVKELFPLHDYSKSDLTLKSDDSIEAYCTVHKKHFKTTRKSCLSGSNGCKLCVVNYYDKETFVEYSNKLHNNKYDYSKFKYIDSATESIIICPLHKEFKKSPNLHTSQLQGCPVCGSLNAANKRRSNTEEFIQKAVLRHGDKYDYSLVNYKASADDVEIICKKHNYIFEQTPSNHLRYTFCCPLCLNESKVSIQEVNLGKWLGRFSSVILSYRPSWLKLDTKEPCEIDIYIPELNLGIEYNGTYWHSSKQKEKNYHQRKYDICKQNGVSLIHIFEFEGLDKWKKKLSFYFTNPDDFEVLFSNEKRTIKSLEIYGKSFIKRKAK